MRSQHPEMVLNEFSCIPVGVRVNDVGGDHCLSHGHSVPDEFFEKTQVVVVCHVRLKLYLTATDLKHTVYVRIL